MTTRRDFGKSCAAAVLFGRRFLRAAGRVPLTWTVQPDSTAGWERRYRADAQIILLGIPVLHRSNVGDGSAGWRECAADDGTAVRMLEFTGRSAPERAAGLNRFGFIQELSRTVDASRREAIYFGLMTSSPEESAADARKALHSTSKDAWYSVIEGRMGADGIETARARFQAPARTSPGERQELIERARVALANAEKTRNPAQSAPHPFLHALASLLSGPRTAETQYAYNGRLYRLSVEKSPDAKAAALFREQRLISAAAGVIRVAGSLRRLEGGKPTEFRLWVEDGSPRPLPLRIEYQPKSYLRLTFEAQS
jgi:hypothetical protein